mmetsp:Transcript_79884/g.191836  ORF Transcript_79884/g.191836 Transcript_79884/m.191836 type:complete len:224 (+) Transcript_79884:1610-2281(+)
MPGVERGLLHGPAAHLRAEPPHVQHLRQGRDHGRAAHQPVGPAGARRVFGPGLHRHLLPEERRQARGGHPGERVRGGQQGEDHHGLPAHRHHRGGGLRAAPRQARLRPGAGGPLRSDPPKDPQGEPAAQHLPLRGPQPVHRGLAAGRADRRGDHGGLQHRPAPRRQLRGVAAHSGVEASAGSAAAGGGGARGLAPHQGAAAGASGLHLPLAARHRRQLPAGAP